MCWKCVGFWLWGFLICWGDLFIFSVFWFCGFYFLLVGIVQGGFVVCLFFFFLIFLNLFFNHPTFLISKSLYCRKQFFVTLYPVEELMVIKTLTLGLFSMTLTSFEMQNLFRLSNPYTQYSSILSFSPILFSPLLLSWVKPVDKGLTSFFVTSWV